MGITYKLDRFEGPLDLLLHLIEKNKVDIYDIPIIEITKQYLDYVRNMETDDLDIMSDFLVMAATLLDIKARMLLPKEKDEEGEEIDPREELVARLLEYKRFKYMASELSDMEDEALKYCYGEQSIPDEVAHYIPPADLDSLLSGVSIDRLRAVFLDVMRRREEKVDPIRSNFGVIKRERVSLGEKIIRVIDYAKGHRRFSFRQMLEREPEKMDVVVTFLAVLELMKMGRIRLTQEKAFSDIEIEATDSLEDAETLDLSGITDK